jgi:hypothetical protein
MRRSPAFWLTLLLLLLALSNVVAEAYLAGFGRPGMHEGPGYSVAEILYDLRHLVTFLLPLLLVPTAAVLLLVGIFRGWQLRRAPVQLLLVVGVLLGGVVLLWYLPWTTHAVRQKGFERAAERMQPLVLAIRRFEHENGRPPSALGQLAPTYLQDVERFGVRGCRPLEYYAGDIPGTWELRLQCPNGWITLDQFFYRPNERYAPHEYNQRFHDWAYFWD